MPSLYSAIELRAGIEYAVVILLVMNRPRDAVPKHAFGQAGQGIDGVIAQKRRSA